MKSFLFFLFACLSVVHRAEAAPAAKKTMRLFVAPFESEMRGKELDALSLGLASFLTERFEEGFAGQAGNVSVASGPLILTSRQASLREGPRAPLDPEAARAVAVDAGATHVMTGTYSGNVSAFTLTVSLYELDPVKGLRPLAELSAGPVSVYAKKPPRPGIQIGDVQSMASTLAAQALARAGIDLRPADIERLKVPQTPDAVSFIEYARALDRHFHPTDFSKHRTALELVEHAVRIWPDFHAARRLYGYLLWQSGELGKARIHLGEILNPTQPAEPSKPRRVGLPDDVRALTMLARIEIESRQYRTAIGYLERAVSRAPEDAQIRFLFGEAFVAAGERLKALAQYESGRKLDPNDLGTRRALSGLYAGLKRYDEASEELQVVIAREPHDLQALFLLAACHRAGNHPEKALADYEAGMERFPDDARLQKFRADMLTALGRASEAQDALAWARKLAPKDGRFSGKPALFGTVLIATLAADAVLRDGMERYRAEAQLAASVATWDLSWNGQEACKDGRAGSYLLLAQASAGTYDRDGSSLGSDAERIAAALKNGEGFALTPDEQERADGLLAYADASVRDLRELATAYEVARSSFARLGCGFDGMHAATIEQVRERNRHLHVEMLTPPPRAASALMPVIPGDVDNVTFEVLNGTASEMAIVFPPDGKALEPPVPPGSPGKGPGRRSYTVKRGHHGFCVLPREKVADCGKPGTVRTDYFHEGWTISVRQ